MTLLYFYRTPTPEIPAQEPPIPYTPVYSDPENAHSLVGYTRTEVVPEPLEEALKVASGLLLSYETFVGAVAIPE